MNLYQSTDVGEHKAILEFNENYLGSSYGTDGIPYCLYNGIMYKAIVPLITDTSTPDTPNIGWSSTEGDVITEDIVMVNSWVAYGLQYAQPLKYHYKNGTVTLSGVIKDGVAPAIGVINHPLGRPMNTLLFPASSGAGTGTVAIRSDGTIDMVDGSNSIFSIEVSYRPNIAYDSWLGVTFENGWVNYGGQFQELEYLVNNEDVHIRGTCKLGNGVIFTIPPIYRPSKTLRFTVCSGATVGTVEINSSGQVRLVDGDNSIVSIQFKYKIGA